MQPANSSTEASLTSEFNLNTERCTASRLIKSPEVARRFSTSIHLGWETNHLHLNGSRLGRRRL